MHSRAFPCILSHSQAFSDIPSHRWIICLNDVWHPLANLKVKGQRWKVKGKKILAFTLSCFSILSVIPAHSPTFSCIPVHSPAFPCILPHSRTFPRIPAYSQSFGMPENEIFPPCVRISCRLAVDTRCNGIMTSMIYEKEKEKKEWYSR